MSSRLDTFCFTSISPPLPFKKLCGCALARVYYILTVLTLLYGYLERSLILHVVAFASQPYEPHYGSQVEDK